MVRSVPMVLSPLVELGRQLHDIARNPTALFGGLLGTTLLTGGVAALVMFGPTFEVNADDGEELDMAFVPGELVRLGKQLDPSGIPDKPIVQDTIAAPSGPDATVTRDDTQPAAPRPDVEKRDTKASEQPDPNKRGAEQSDRNRDANTPYEDPATVEDLPGDPFGDPGGWSDVAKAGDPWATEVMKVLNGLAVGVYAGESKGGVYKFRLEVCPDGSLKAQRKQSSGDSTLDGSLEAEIARKRVPVPRNVGDLLKGKCQKIKYEFTWRGTSGGRGNVQ